MFRQYVTLEICLETKGVLRAAFEGAFGALLVLPKDVFTVMWLAGKRL
jgi:hypothetical protein